MSLDTPKHLGGRPKKKAKELQKTHSLRATDKDWKAIQLAARTIKACKTVDDPHVLVLNKEEFARVNKLLLNEVIEQRHDSLGEIRSSTPSVLPSKKIEPQKPISLEEEEAVSVFLEYFRLNPIEASAMVQSRLDKEKRILRAKENRKKQNRIIDQLEKKTNFALDTADEINRRVAEMLHFSQ